jgi:murein DD-endopeptidase MepM/ murein hydrolase activator NlpD
MKFQTQVIVFLLILTSLTKLFGQVAIPKGYFASPLAIDLALTGSFGEVRPNHFHSGIDFSVQGKVGLPVFAVADGVVFPYQGFADWVWQRPLYRPPKRIYISLRPFERV